MKAYRHIVTDNPMLAEIGRFRRKWLNPRNVVSGLAISLCAIVYIILLWLSVTMAPYGPGPLLFFYIQVGALTIMIPSMLHGAISGERERRSWDFLLVAPVTKSQIIAGKFLAATSAVLGVSVLMLGPIILAILSQPINDWTYYESTTVRSYGFTDFIAQESIALSWALLVCALTLFISARSKRLMASLGTSITVLVVVLILVPILYAMLPYAGPSEGNFGFLNFHPFVALTTADPLAFRFEEEVSYPTWPMLSLMYLGFAGGLLYWATLTIGFADNNPAFVKRNARSKEPA